MVSRTRPATTDGGKVVLVPCPFSWRRAAAVMHDLHLYAGTWLYHRITGVASMMLLDTLFPSMSAPCTSSP